MNPFHFLTPQPSNLLNLEIEGARLRLLAVSSEFEQEIFQEFTSEVTRYMFPFSPQHINETRRFITASRCRMQMGNDLQFVILSKSTGEFLGCCGLHGEDTVRTPELGIWIKKSAHGSGYGREAIHTLVNWACENIDLDYFTYSVDRSNIPSRKIPESLGGEVVEQVKVETPSGKLLEQVIYKIDRPNTFPKT